MITFFIYNQASIPLFYLFIIYKLVYLFHCLLLMKNFTVLETTKPIKSYLVQYYKQTPNKFAYVT